MRVLRYVAGGMAAGCAAGLVAWFFSEDSQAATPAFYLTRSLAAWASSALPYLGAGLFLGALGGIATSIRAPRNTNQKPAPSLHPRAEPRLAPEADVLTAEELPAAAPEANEADGKAFQALKHKCRHASLVAESARESGPPGKINRIIWDRYIEFKDTILEELVSITDPFYQSAVLQEVVDMLIIAGEDDEARRLIPHIEVAFLRERAERHFLAGAKSIAAERSAREGTEPPLVHAREPDVVESPVHDLHRQGAA